ncbi:MAG: hypothetical protein HN742_03075 [Lentisphaerae bacterium]|jgi:hypothetical protein|nr:hypothetical protein [Lentisphaerota bacterium]MBT4814621.1 hypothetical protein [Lentisphaerota bacterium]MBT5605452.1 hypothetical protein [Lentisphaerota bacterium]MBT7060117.1 hypothetical protein [Lentisphaerota bacterium]MBT7840823.1 hypothetical protein [Lentisphaerota bacterium]
MDIVASYRRVIDTPDMVQGSPEDISPTRFGKIVDLLKASGRTDCCVRGNEPTAHAEFERLLAIAEKGRIRVHVETCGLLTAEARRLLEDRPLPVILKLYRPSVYEPGQLEEVAAAIGAINAAYPDRLRVCAVIDDLMQPLDYIESFVGEVGARSVAFRIVCPKELDQLRAFTGDFVPVVTGLGTTGVRVSLECGLPPCVFSDADYGALAKLDCLPMRCLPQPGVLPDLRVFHCWSLISRATGNLGAFRQTGQALDFLFSTFADAQCDLRPFADCTACPSASSEACVGPCLALKLERIEEDVARLRTRVEDDATQEDLVQLGVRYWQLRKFSEARDCLVEARRGDPGNGGVHLMLGRVYHRLGDLAGMEEEYEKAARLSREPAPVLAELGRAFGAVGKAGKARKVLARLSALEAEAQSHQRV